MGRLFNEKEVNKILRKASASQSGEADGITLEQLKQVGSELGFDPNQIELAARDLGGEPQSRGGFLQGRVVLDRTLDVPIGPEDWLGMVAAAQRHYKKEGAVTQRSSNYDWVASDSEGGSSLTLTVMNREGRSRIQVESGQWFGPLFTVLFGTVFGFVFSSVAFKQGYHWAPFAICAGFALGMFLLLRVLRASHVNSVSLLMDRLTAEVDTEVRAGSSPLGLAAPVTPHLGVPIEPRIG